MSASDESREPSSKLIVATSEDDPSKELIFDLETGRVWEGRPYDDTPSFSPGLANCFTASGEPFAGYPPSTCHPLLFKDPSGTFYLYQRMVSLILTSSLHDVAREDLRLGCAKKFQP